MKKSSELFLNLFFNPGETICLSNSQYAYHSIDPILINTNEIPMRSPNETIKEFYIKEEEIALVSINPINGFRNDNNVTAFRSFLVEMDNGSLADQKTYIDNIGLPYSCCVFSGNKSLHFGIVLDKDILDISIWRFTAEWILNILKKADPLTKNPSRSIRFPENKRPDGKEMVQKLVDIRGRVSQTALYNWLNKFPEKRPELSRPKPIISAVPSQHNIPTYIKNWLESGVHTLTERNNKWFIIASTYAERGFSEDETVSILEEYFMEENDLKYKEWHSTIKSAFKYIYRKEC
jgi:hypothetical protein